LFGVEVHINLQVKGVSNAATSIRMIYVAVQHGLNYRDNPKTSKHFVAVQQILEA
jgi:hypothetical protein